MSKNPEKDEHGVHSIQNWAVLSTWKKNTQKYLRNLRWFTNVNISSTYLLKKINITSYSI